MNNNILLEVKNLNKAICQQIFEIGKDNSFTKHPSPLQIRVVRYLMNNKEESTYQKDIQESLNVSKAAISETLRSMEKKNIIERIPSKIDGRKIKIILTDKGKETFQEIEKDLLKVNQKVLKSITQEEFEEFIRISHKIEESLKKEGIK